MRRALQGDKHSWIGRRPSRCGLTTQRRGEELVAGVSPEILVAMSLVRLASPQRDEF